MELWNLWPASPGGPTATQINTPKRNSSSFGICAAGILTSACSNYGIGSRNEDTPAVRKACSALCASWGCFLKQRLTRPTGQPPRNRGPIPVSAFRWMSRLFRASVLQIQIYACSNIPPLTSSPACVSSLLTLNNPPIPLLTS